MKMFFSSHRVPTWKGACDYQPLCVPELGGYQWQKAQRPRNHEEKYGTFIHIYHISIIYLHIACDYCGTAFRTLLFPCYVMDRNMWRGKNMKIPFWDCFCGISVYFQCLTDWRLTLMSLTLPSQGRTILISFWQPITFLVITVIKCYMPKWPLGCLQSPHTFPKIIIWKKSTGLEPTHVLTCFNLFDLDLH